MTRKLLDILPDAGEASGRDDDGNHDEQRSGDDYFDEREWKKGKVMARVSTRSRMVLSTTGCRRMLDVWRIHAMDVDRASSVSL